MGFDSWTIEPIAHSLYWLHCFGSLSCIAMNLYIIAYSLFSLIAGALVVCIEVLTRLPNTCFSDHSTDAFLSWKIGFIGVWSVEIMELLWLCDTQLYHGMYLLSRCVTVLAFHNCRCLVVDVCTMCVVQALLQGGRQVPCTAIQTVPMTVMMRMKKRAWQKSHSSWPMTWGPSSRRTWRSQNTCRYDLCLLWLSFYE